MAGDDFQQGTTSMIREATAHTPGTPEHFVHPGSPADARVPGSRRISVVAWGLAGVTGILLWALIFELVVKLV